MAKRQGEAVARARVSIYGYGSPQHLAKLLDSTAALVDREPAPSFVDETARSAALHLSGLLVSRIEDAGREQPDADRHRLRAGRRGVPRRTRDGAWCSRSPRP